MALYFVLIVYDKHRIRVLIYYFARMQQISLDIFHNILFHNDGNYAARKMINFNVKVWFTERYILQQQTFRLVTVKLVLQLGQLSTSSSSCQRTDVSAARIFSNSICHNTAKLIN